MARTRDPRRAEAEANPSIPLTPAQKTTTKAAPKGKRAREADKATTVKEEPTGAKKIKTTVSNSKRQREVDNITSETEHAVPTKKTKTAPKKVVAEPKTNNISPRRSGRAHKNAPATPQRRKRRTREEIAADKAKADAEKRQKEELTKENHHAMMQMDIEEDTDRAEVAARTVRSFADLDREAESDAEEFVGYHDVLGSEDSDSDGNAAVKLKVSMSWHI